MLIPFIDPSRSKYDTRRHHEGKRPSGPQSKTTKHHLCVNVCLCDKSDDDTCAPFTGCEAVLNRSIVPEPQLGAGEGQGTGEDESADEDDDAPEDQGSGEPRGGLDMLADAIEGIDAGSGEEPQDEVHPS